METKYDRTETGFIKTELKGVYIVEPKVIGDYRGWFSESWSKRDFEEAGIFLDFVQDNHSFSAKKGTLRGLHFQRGEYSQAKYVRCTRGAIRDVAVDLRHESPSYLKWLAVELSEENKRALIIPRGFAHGFLSLTDDVEFLYRVDNYYNPDSEASIRYDDPQFAIDWGFDRLFADCQKEGGDAQTLEFCRKKAEFEPILAKKDKEAPFYSEYGILF